MKTMQAKLPHPPIVHMTGCFFFITYLKGHLFDTIYVGNYKLSNINVYHRQNNSIYVCKYIHEHVFHMLL